MGKEVSYEKQEVYTSDKVIITNGDIGNRTVIAKKIKDVVEKDLKPEGYKDKKTAKYLCDLLLQTANNAVIDYLNDANLVYKKEVSNMAKACIPYMDKKYISRAINKLNVSKYINAKPQELADDIHDAIDWLSARIS